MDENTCPNPAPWPPQSYGHFLSLVPHQAQTTSWTNSNASLLVEALEGLQIGVGCDLQAFKKRLDRVQKHLKHRSHSLRDAARKVVQTAITHKTAYFNPDLGSWGTCLESLAEPLPCEPEAAIAITDAHLAAPPCVPINGLVVEDDEPPCLSVRQPNKVLGSQTNLNIQLSDLQYSNKALKGHNSRFTYNIHMLEQQLSAKAKELQQCTDDFARSKEQHAAKVAQLTARVAQLRTNGDDQASELARCNKHTKALERNAKVGTQVFPLSSLKRQCNPQLMYSINSVLTVQ